MDAAYRAFEGLPNVSRETIKAFSVWKSLLEQWNPRINLVQRSSLSSFWIRHAADSWQIEQYIPRRAQIVLDLGSGGGFPGLSNAIALKHRGQGRAILVESVAKKCAFLREVSRQLDLGADIRNSRVEDVENFTADVVTARAFAPLSRLLSYAAPFMGVASRAVLLKGRCADDEIAAARKYFDFDLQRHPSHTDENGHVLIISNVSQI